jgi:AcrR family transcriptional regulator
VTDGRRVRMSASERREQLVGVARSVFAEKGFEATSVEEIAERAGVSKPVVYQHFGGKEGLYAVVVDREVTSLTSRITGALDTRDPRRAAEDAAAAFLGYIEECEEGFRVLVRDAPVGMTGGTFASVITDVASRAELLLLDSYGERGFAEDTAPIYARMLVGAVALVGEWWLEVREPSRDEVAAHVVNLLWNGLKRLEPDPRPRRRPVEPPARHPSPTSPPPLRLADDTDERRLRRPADGTG